MSKINPQLPHGLFAILDLVQTEEIGACLVEVVEAFVDSGATPFIVRAPHLNQMEYARLIGDITALQEIMSFDFLIHHQLNPSLASAAVGVHLTARSAPVTEVRKILGPHKLIGYSAHSRTEALQAIHNGANFIFLGSIFETPKPHPRHPTPGINELAKLCGQTNTPVYAIGGIDAHNLKHIKNAGAHGFSALRAVYKDGTMEHNTAKLKILWENI